MVDVIGRLIPNSMDLEFPGQFYWLADQDGNLYSGLGYMCPCGCGQRRAINVHRSAKGYGWQWDGNIERPTLSPSIWHKENPRFPENCGWHGFLVKGIWKEA